MNDKVNDQINDDAKKLLADRANAPVVPAGARKEPAKDEAPKTN